MSDKTISSYFEVGEKIKARRKELGLKQKDLAKKSGVPLRTIQSNENNEVNQKISLLKQIAVALDCDFEQFLEKPKDFDRLKEVEKIYSKFQSGDFVKKLYGISERLHNFAKELEKLAENIEALND